MRKKRIIAILAVATALAVFTGISAGVATAYLSTSPGKVTNIITAGEIEIELKEDRWIPDGYDSVYPGQIIEKNPVITNTGKNSAHVFLKVRIPVRNIAVVSKDGRKTEKKARELFSFEADTADWELISRERESDNMVYVYAYKTVLDPELSTTPIFDSVTMINYLEGELDSSECFAIDVHALAIQTGIDTAEQKPEQIYEVLLQQAGYDSSYPGTAGTAINEK